MIAAAVLAAGLWHWRSHAGPPAPFPCAEPSGLVGDDPAAAEAIARGEAFLQTRSGPINPAMTLVLDFVGRRYGVPWMRASADPLRTPSAATPCAGEGECGTPPSLYAYRRMIDPAAEIPADQYPTGNTLDAFTAVALHCRTNGLPAEYPQRIAHWLDPAGGDYDPTHAALAMQWAIEQGCLDLGSEAVRALRTRAIEQLLAAAAGVPRDQSIEALAMLDYVGEWRCVRAAWIDEVIRAQRWDGGWGDGAEQPSNEHTTTLALWVLLARTRPPQALAWIPQAGDVR